MQKWPSNQKCKLKQLFFTYEVSRGKKVTFNDDLNLLKQSFLAVGGGIIKC